MDRYFVALGGLLYRCWGTSPRRLQVYRLPIGRQARHGPTATAGYRYTHDLADQSFHSIIALLSYAAAHRLYGSFHSPGHPLGSLGVSTLCGHKDHAALFGRTVLHTSGLDRLIRPIRALDHYVQIMLIITSFYRAGALPGVVRL